MPKKPPKKPKPVTKRKEAQERNRGLPLSKRWSYAISLKAETPEGAIFGQPIKAKPGDAVVTLRVHSLNFHEERHVDYKLRRSEVRPLSRLEFDLQDQDRHLFADLVKSDWGAPTVHLDGQYCGANLWEELEVWWLYWEDGTATETWLPFSDEAEQWLLEYRPSSARVLSGWGDSQ